MLDNNDVVNLFHAISAQVSNSQIPPPLAKNPLIKPIIDQFRVIQKRYAKCGDAGKQAVLEGVKKNLPGEYQHFSTDELKGWFALFNKIDEKMKHLKALKDLGAPKPRHKKSDSIKELNQLVTMSIKHPLAEDQTARAVSSPKKVIFKDMVSSLLKKAVPANQSADSIASSALVAAVPDEPIAPATAVSETAPVESVVPATVAPEAAVVEPVVSAAPSESAPEEPIKPAVSSESAPEEPIKLAVSSESAPEEPIKLAAAPSESAPEEPIKPAAPSEVAAEEPIKPAVSSESAPEEPIKLAAAPSESAPEEPIKPAAPSQVAAEEPIKPAAAPSEAAPEEPIKPAAAPSKSAPEEPIKLAQAPSEAAPKEPIKSATALKSAPINPPASQEALVKNVESALLAYQGKFSFTQILHIAGTAHKADFNSTICTDTEREVIGAVRTLQKNYPMDLEETNFIKNIRKKNSALTRVTEQLDALDIQCSKFWKKFQALENAKHAGKSINEAKLTLYKDSYKAVDTITKTMQKFIDDYLKSPQNDLNAFKAKAKLLLEGKNTPEGSNIKNQLDTLSTHRGCKDIIVNLLFFIFTAGLANLGCAVYSLCTGRSSLLFQPSTETSSIVDELAKSADTAAFSK